MTELDKLKITLLERDKFIVNLVSELDAAYITIDNAKELHNFIIQMKSEIKTLALDFSSAIKVLKEMKGMK